MPQPRQRELLLVNTPLLRPQPWGSALARGAGPQVEVVDVTVLTAEEAEAVRSLSHLQPLRIRQKATRRLSLSSSCVIHHIAGCVSLVPSLG